MTTVTLDQALAKGHGTWRSFTCPEHADANPSARVNVNTGKWVCMVCHAKGTTAGYVPDIDAMLEDAIATLDSIDLEKPEGWLDQFDSGPVAHYWLSRFDEATCRFYRLGWDGMKGKPCYPIRSMNGRPLGVVHRNVDDPGGPKYKYPTGVNTSALLFGHHELVQTEVLFLVEGAMDVAAVRECGHDALGTYGSRLYSKQVAEIASLHPRIVYIAYDMDKAGYAGALMAQRDLSEAGVLCQRMTWHDRYSDLGEMNLATRSNTLSHALASTFTER